MSDGVDLNQYSDDDLSRLSQKIAIERERRALLANAESRQEQLQVEVLQARDGVSEDGSPFPWVKPETPMEAYPLNWRVSRDETIYRSKVRSNTYTPSASSDYWEVVKIEETE